MFQCARAAICAGGGGGTCLIALGMFCPPGASATCPAGRLGRATVAYAATAPICAGALFLFGVINLVITAADSFARCLAGCILIFRLGVACVTRGGATSAFISGLAQCAGCTGGATAVDIISRIRGHTVCRGGPCGTSVCDGVRCDGVATVDCFIWCLVPASCGRIKR